MREIVLPLPPSTNHLYDHRRRGVFISREYEAFQWAAWESMKQQEVLPFDTPPAAIQMDYEMFMPSARCDVTNYIKAAEDVVAKYLGFNDNRVTEGSFAKFVDRKSPRLVVRIEDISGQPRREPGFSTSGRSAGRAQRRK